MKRQHRDLIRLALDEGVKHPMVEPGKPHPRLVGVVNGYVLAIPVSSTRGTRAPYVRQLVRKQVAELRARA